jgi:hypothetical protein
MRRCTIVLAVLGVTLAAASQPAQAATISAVPDSRTFRVGESGSVSFFLVLEEGELASAAAATFGFVGLGTTGAVSINTDPPCGGAQIPEDPRCVLDAGKLRVTTGWWVVNLGGTRPLGGVDVEFVGPGRFDVVLIKALTQFDLPDPPFIVDVPVTVPPGTVLSRIEVIPEPSTLLLLVLGGLASAVAVRRAGRRR